jgi:hypothetical protein
MAGQKTSKKKGPSPKPSLTNRRCVKCDQRILSPEIATVLMIDMAARSRRMAFYHKACRS